MDYTDLFTTSLHNEGAEVQLVDMEGNLVDIYLTIAGVDSKVWRNELHVMKRKSMLNSQLAWDEQEDIDPDEAVCEGLAKCVLGWRGFTLNGEEVEFSTEKVKQLFLEAPYLRDHVDRFFSNRENFTKGKASE